MIMQKAAGKIFLSVIIPAFNEEKTIGSVIKDVKSLDDKYSLEIIVVDDGSEDKTALQAKKYGADRILSHKTNLGKGAAFRTGLKAADGEYVVQIDADGQLKASEIPKLISYLSEYDLVLGARYNFFSLATSDFTSFIKMCGNFFLSFTTTMFARMNITDVMTGLKAFRKNTIKSLNLSVNDFGYEAEIVVKAAKRNFKIKNVTIKAGKRLEGKSNLRSMKHGLSVIWTIVRSSL